MKVFLVLLSSGFYLHFFALHAFGAGTNFTPGDAMLRDYFLAETEKLETNSLTNFQSLEDWTQQRAGSRTALLDMLGLWPLPERTDLKAMTTGAIDHDLCRVEKVHFQSRPGLYVTGNLYLPANLTKPAPAILYLSGHGPVIEQGISYGNKVTYQHHGAWLAQNGYACLILDTLQLGEIQGLHHGTSRDGLWWWNSRGYTPAGVEAWNAMRALDYLETRPEVDRERLGVTGRSGGGAYSWWLAALDERIKVAAPVAGITDLRNHVVDGTVEGHCDCMFMVNTYRWDYPQVAALVAPRPLLIANTDNDSIFPLDGVVRLHRKVRGIYNLYRASDKLGLLITEGPHKDTQDLQLPVLRWFNRHLRGEERVIESAARKLFKPQELKVLPVIPPDQINTQIQEQFVVKAARPEVPASDQDWQQLRASWIQALREKSFANWPLDPPPLQLTRHASGQTDSLHFEAYDFLSQANVPLRLYLLRKATTKRPQRVLLSCLGETEAPTVFGFLRAAFPKQMETEGALLTSSDGGIDANELTDDEVLAYFAPRGVGLTSWPGSEKKTTQIKRRFMLLGQTLDGMRVWDIRRAITALRALPETSSLLLDLAAKGNMSVNVLYAALFEDNIHSLILSRIPPTHQEGPDYLNVLRILDIPEAMALALDRADLVIYRSVPAVWEYATATKKQLNWSQRQLTIK